MKYTLFIILFTIQGLHLFSQKLIVPDNYNSIQAAIDAASDGDTVLVKPGEYLEILNFNGKAIVVGSEYLINPDPLIIENTVINGQNRGFIVSFNNGEDSSSQLIGFTLINSGNDSILNKRGYVLVHNTSPIIANNYFLQSDSMSWNSNFGGITCINSDAKIISNKFSYIIHNSTSQGYGACIVAIEGAPVIKNNMIYKGYFGGVDYAAGILLMQSNAHVSGNFINKLSCGFIHKFAGGIIAIESNSLIEFNIHSNDQYLAAQRGAIVSIKSNLDIINNTIYDHAYAINTSGAGTINVKNTIFWNSINDHIFSLDSLTSINISYSNIENGYPGVGNINADPIFADPLQADFNLLPNSPCIEAGDPLSPKKLNGKVTDIGALLYNNYPSLIIEKDKSKVLGFPNPTNGQYYIRLNKNKNKEIKISLYSLDGKFIHNFNKLNFEDQLISFDLTFLPSGVYYMHIISDGVQELKVVQKI